MTDISRILEKLQLLAASEGDAEATELAIQAGAPLEIRDECGRTPLLRAAELGNTGVARLLIEAGADLHAVDTDEHSLLHHAILHATFYTDENHESQIEIIRQALDAGVDPCGKTTGGETPLHLATKSDSEAALAIARMLIDYGADLEARDQEEDTPTMFAASWGLVETLSLLLGAGADINAQDDLGYSALHWASRNGRKATIRLLLDHGAAPDIETQQGATPLMLAAEYGSAEPVRMLLTAGADAQRARRDNETAASIAAGYLARDLEDSLIDRAREHLMPGSDQKIVTSTWKNETGETVIEVCLREPNGSGLSWRHCEAHRKIDDLLQAALRKSSK